MREPQLLSVVAPLHDEEDNVEAFHRRTTAALEGLAFELVLVDDGSRDATGEKLRALAAGDKRVKVIALSRNFGHQAAISAGLEHARGDVVVMIDADLQDPPELIPEMVDAWRKGADVVYAVRSSREGETRFKLATARWFYKLFAKLARVELAENSGDFRMATLAPTLPSVMALDGPRSRQSPRQLHRRFQAPPRKLRSCGSRPRRFHLFRRSSP